MADRPKIKEPEKMLPRFYDIEIDGIKDLAKRNRADIEIMQKSIDGMVIDKEDMNLKRGRLEEIEKNFSTILNDIEQLFDIKVEGVGLDQQVQQVENFFRDEMYKEAAGNGYHGLKEMLKARESFRIKQDALVLLFNAIKSELGG